MEKHAHEEPECGKHVESRRSASGPAEACGYPVVCTSQNTTGAFEPAVDHNVHGIKTRILGVY